VAKKTVQLRDMVQSANDRMANPKLSQRDKMMVYLFVDDFLHRNNAYAGFGYLELPVTDETEYNRFFYLHRDLKK
jgi:hypothetical protein